MTRHRLLASLGGLTAILAIVWLVRVAAAAQPTQAADPKKATVPRTPWGAPDFQGVWTNFDETPFEQPNPDPVAAAKERAVTARRYGGAGDAPRPWNAHDSPTSKRRPSLVVDPPDGRIPVVPGTVDYRGYDGLEDSWDNHIPMERCITRGVPGGMFPYAYNDGYQILQTPDYVVILPEMIHDARIIPLDGRPHVGQSIRLWNGDSRGRWEANTLVIDTTNYNDKGHVGSGGAVISMRQSEALHVVERLTRVNASTLEYTATIDDHNLFTRPWTVGLPFNRDPAYQIYEYACHEGNRRYMEGALRAGRVAEKTASGAKRVSK